MARMYISEVSRKKHKEEQSKCRHDFVPYPKSKKCTTEYCRYCGKQRRIR